MDKLGEPEVVEKWAQLADQYGLALILAIVLMIVVLYILRLFITGQLVPRELLDKAEEQRDNVTEAMAELEETLEQLTVVVNNIKRDPQDRGG